MAAEQHSKFDREQQARQQSVKTPRVKLLGSGVQQQHSSKLIGYAVTFICDRPDQVTLVKMAAVQQATQQSNQTPRVTLVGNWNAAATQQKGSGLIGQAERYPLSGREAGQFSAGKNSEARQNGDARRGKKGTQAQGRKTRCAVQEVQGRKVGKVCWQCSAGKYVCTCAS